MDLKDKPEMKRLKELAKRDPKVKKRLLEHLKDCEDQHQKERPEIMDVEQAADFLQVKPVTIYRLLKAGTIPARKVGRQWRFSRSKLLAWVEAGKGNRPK